jgi:hypothetical protein
MLAGNDVPVVQKQWLSGTAGLVCSWLHCCLNLLCRGNVCGLLLAQPAHALAVEVHGRCGITYHVESAQGSGNASTDCSHLALIAELPDFA